MKLAKHIVFQESMLSSEGKGSFTRSLNHLLNDLLKYGNYQLYLSIKEVKNHYNTSLMSDE